jgi:hypothetical protein
MDIQANELTDINDESLLIESEALIEQSKKPRMPVEVLAQLPLGRLVPPTEASNADTKILATLSNHLLSETVMEADVLLAMNNDATPTSKAEAKESFLNKKHWKPMDVQDVSFTFRQYPLKLIPVIYYIGKPIRPALLFLQELPNGTSRVLIFYNCYNSVRDVRQIKLANRFSLAFLNGAYKQTSHSLSISELGAEMLVLLYCIMNEVKSISDVVESTDCGAIDALGVFNDVYLVHVPYPTMSPKW